MALVRNEAIDHVPSQPDTRRAKFFRSAPPWGGVHHFGVELDAVEMACIVSDGGEGR